MKSTFKVLFYLKKGSEKKNGEVRNRASSPITGALPQAKPKAGMPEE